MRVQTELEPLTRKIAGMKQHYTHVTADHVKFAGQLRAVIGASYSWVETNHPSVCSRKGSRDFVMLLAFLSVSLETSWSSMKRMVEVYKSWKRMACTVTDTTTIGGLGKLRDQAKDRKGDLRFSDQCSWLRRAGIVKQDPDGYFSIVLPEDLASVAAASKTIKAPTLSVRFDLEVEPWFKVGTVLVDFERAKSVHKLVPGAVMFSHLSMPGTGKPIDKELEALILSKMGTEWPGYTLID